jgi:hypothetical protein
MSFIVKDDQERKLVSAGVKRAVCIGIYDIGTHKVVHKDVEAMKPQAIIVWELPDERMIFDEVDKPMVISRRYMNVSMNKKATFRKDLEAWRGKQYTEEEVREGIDMKSFLGTTCQVQVTHVERDGQTYANVTSLMAVPDGTKPLKAEHPLGFFTFQGGDPWPDDTPDWIVDLIGESAEAKEGDLEPF